MKSVGGIRVVDVWQSAEQFQHFADNQIGPIAQEVGMAPPEVQMYEVHNYLTAGWLVPDAQRVRQTLATFRV